jgi:hypothetical protein
MSLLIMSVALNEMVDIFWGNDFQWVERDSTSLVLPVLSGQVSKYRTGAKTNVAQ